VGAFTISDLGCIIASMKFARTFAWLVGVLLLLTFFNVSCGVLSQLEDLCNCRPLLPDIFLQS
jgi:hypothetical protein